MGAKVEREEAQKSSTKALKRSENDLKINHVNVHQDVGMRKKLLNLGAPKASWEFKFASQRLLASDLEALEVPF